MTTYLVSLISENLLPNFLFIKEFTNKYDSLIFLTTQSMSNQSLPSRLEKALNVEAKSSIRITVSEDNFSSIFEKLAAFSPNSEDTFIVNVTGGTKIMSLAAYNFFSQYKNASFYYVPIGKNKIVNVNTATSTPISYKINLDEYLALLGFHFEHSTSNLNNLKGGKETIGLAFEAHCYGRIKNENRLESQYIKQGVKVRRDKNSQNTDNELDVIWVIDNTLHIAECKHTLNKPKTKPHDYLDTILYKLSAISKDFGLRVNSYVFTRHNLVAPDFNTDRLNALSKKMKILGIKKIFAAKDLKNVMKPLDFS